jgi:hypothetical protein
MNWILLIIISTRSYSDHKAVTTTTIPFESKVLCEKAEEKISTPYGYEVQTECLRSHSDEPKKEVVK